LNRLTGTNPVHRGYQPFRRQLYNLMPTTGLELSDVGTDGMKVEIEPLGVLIAEPANFLDDGIDHSNSPKTSSGEQISGHAKP
jgi:hypothetical protein